MKEWTSRNVLGSQRSYVVEDDEQGYGEKSTVQMEIEQNEVSVYEKGLVAVQEDVVMKCEDVGHLKIGKCVKELNKAEKQFLEMKLSLLAKANHK